MLILLLSNVLSEDLNCQYKEIESYEVEEERWYLGSKLIEGKPEITETSTNRDPSWAKFKVHNPFNFSIEVEISYWARSNWYGHRQFSATGIIMSKEYSILEGGFGEGSLSDVKMQILQPDGVHTKIENVKKEIPVCKKCNGEVCLDDGEPCNKSKQCGGGFCIEYICSNSEKCYNNDCECDEDKVQCEDNTKCVKKKSVEIGSKPVCSFEECITKYIDPETGLCAKSTEQIFQENQQREQQEKKRLQNVIIMISILLVVATLIALFFGVQKIKAKTKLKEKEIEVIKEKSKLATMEVESRYKSIEVIKSSINELRKNIDELERLKDIKSNEKKLLEDLYKDLEDKKSELQKTREEIKKISEEGWSSIKPFPYELVGNRLVIPNPFLGGYLCFYDEDLALNEYPYNKLVHRWLWKKYYGRLPRPNHHIHHNDGDKFNNDIKNLEEVKGDEHYILHRNQFEK